MAAPEGQEGSPSPGLTVETSAPERVTSSPSAPETVPSTPSAPASPASPSAEMSASAQKVLAKRRKTFRQNDNNVAMEPLDGGQPITSPASARAVLKSQQTAEILKVAERIDTQTQHYRIIAEKEPWLNEDGTINAAWSHARIICGTLLTSPRFEATMAIVICGNFVFIIFDTDRVAQCYPEYFHNLDDCPFRTNLLGWAVALNWLMLIIYSAECMLGLYVFRGQYLFNNWSILDLFVALTGWLEQMGFGSSTSWMKLFRIARLSRLVRVVVQVREMYMLISGFMSSIRAIFFGVFMLLAMIVVCGIILVEFLHPENSLLDHGDCERCPRVYMSVVQSSVTIFQQIVAGDSWGTPSVALIEFRPWTGIVLISILVTIALGVMNLILAVIVESASESRENDMEEKTRLRHALVEQEKVNLLTVCADIDQDRDGCVTLDELFEAWGRFKEFRAIMLNLECGREDLDTLFMMLHSTSRHQRHKAGTTSNYAEDAVEYNVFVDELYRVSTCKPRTIIRMVKMETAGMKHAMEDFVSNRYREFEERIEKKLSRLHRQVDQLVQVVCRASGKAPPGASRAASDARPAAAEASTDPCKELVDVLQRQPELIPDMLNHVRSRNPELVAELLDLARGKQLAANAGEHQPDGDQRARSSSSNESSSSSPADLLESI